MSRQYLESWDPSFFFSCRQRGVTERPSSCRRPLVGHHP